MHYILLPISCLTNVQLIKDPIHGSVELHPLLCKIINTEEFNRLKFIRQLGKFSNLGSQH